MEQEATLKLALFQVIDVLLVFLGAQGGADESLRFTARKQR